MINEVTEKRLALLVSWGALGVTLLVTDKFGYDPVNVGKMVLLSVIAGGCAGLLLSIYRRLEKDHKATFISLAMFLMIGLVSIILSGNPWEKGFFGTYGRNTGLLTYSALAILFFTASLFRRVRSYQSIIIALLFAGLANLIYCNLSIFGYEIFLFNNPYNTILGTFGNPNFIGAFLGIFVTALVGLISSKLTTKANKFWLSAIAMLSLLTIKETQALQGYVVVAAGICLVLFFYIRSSIVNRWILIGYTLFVSSIGTLAALSTLQKGPLGDLLYKPSVSFRGEYWNAGLNMGVDNLLTGVGLDSYGTYYRKYRNESAIESPGVNVTTDASHNVFIDIFAGAGVFGLGLYLLLIFLVLRASLIFAKANKEYDPIFVVLFASWVTYQIQSIVSINQIGLAIWGWVLGGALIGYSQMSREIETNHRLSRDRSFFKFKKKKESSNGQVTAAQSMMMLVGFLLGAIIAAPPFMVDINSRKASSSQSVETIISIAKSWPQDAGRMNNVVFRVAEAGFGNEAQGLVNEVVDRFPDDYSGWYSLFKVTQDGSEQKAKYISKLRSLDPHNPEFFEK